jgi:hypothetical protein
VEDYATQAATMGEAPAFESGVGGSIGGEFHVDGTPMRVATIVIVGVLLLIAWSQTGFRFHVTV